MYIVPVQLIKVTDWYTVIIAWPRLSNPMSPLLGLGPIDPLEDASISKIDKSRPHPQQCRLNQPDSVDLQYPVRHCRNLQEATTNLCWPFLLLKNIGTTDLGNISAHITSLMEISRPKLNTNDGKNHEQEQEKHCHVQQCMHGGKQSPNQYSKSYNYTYHWNENPSAITTLRTNTPANLFTVFRGRNTRSTLIAVTFVTPGMKPTNLRRENRWVSKWIYEGKWTHTQL